MPAASIPCNSHLCAVQKLYHTAGVEGKPVVFLLTDTQLSQDSFLEDVNNLLNSGEVPGMYAQEDKERIIASIRDWLLTQGAPTIKACISFSGMLVSLTSCKFKIADTWPKSRWPQQVHEQYIMAHVAAMSCTPPRTPCCFSFDTVMIACCQASAFLQTSAVSMYNSQIKSPLLKWLR